MKAGPRGHLRRHVLALRCGRARTVAERESAGRPGAWIGLITSTRTLQGVPNGSL